MPHNRKPPRPLRQIAAFSAGLLLSQLQNQAQDTRSDDWFDQQRTEEAPSAAEGREDEKSKAIRSNESSAQKAYNALMKEYNRISEERLTKRIELLSRAAKARPDDNGEAMAALESLQRQKSEILSRLDQAARVEPIEQAIASLAPYKRYFDLDLELSQRLLESPFASRVESLVRDAYSRDDYPAIRSIEASLQSAGLSHLALSRIAPLAKHSESAAIAGRWTAALEESSPLKGERYLVERALQLDDAHLGMAISIKGQDDARLAEFLKTGIARHIGASFAPASVDRADLLLDVDLENLMVSETIAESTRSSVVPGAIDEQPNPEFVKLVAKYEKAAKLYERAMKAYEIAFENWLDMREEPDPMIAENRQSAEVAVHQAEAVARAAGAGPAASGANQALLEAKAEYRLAEQIEKLSAPLNLTKPVEPAPVHLEILKELYATPSTIVLSNEETPYDYTSQTITATFEVEGSIAVAAPNIAVIADSKPVDLIRKRAWVRNLNVNPRDPLIDAGDYGSEAVAAAKDLFLLEYASECAKTLELQLREASELYLASGLENADPQAVLLALSLKAWGTSFTLPESEIRELANLARDDSVSPQQLRQECWVRAARAILAGSPDQQAKAIALLHR